MTVLPDFIQSPDESWFCALAASREEAYTIFQRFWGDLPGGAAVLTEVRLTRVPVPAEHQIDYPEWFEVNQSGDIVGWEIRP